MTVSSTRKNLNGMDRANQREPFEGARATCSALVATTSASALYHASLAEWPLLALAAIAFSGALCTAVAAQLARESGKRWPWVLIAAAVAAQAAGMQPFAARVAASIPPP